MANKQVISALWENGYNYSEIGRICNLSRQRIHQLITRYRTLGDSKKSKRLQNILSKPCAVCRGNTEILHHIDGDSSHNYSENLLPVCKTCHPKLHIGKPHHLNRRFTWSLKHNECQNCHTTTTPPANSELCNNCYYQKHKEYFKLAREKWVRKNSGNCLSCKIKLKSVGSKYCLSCVNKTPEFRTKTSEMMKKRWANRAK